MNKIVDKVIESFNERNEIFKEIERRSRFVKKVVDDVYSSRIAKINNEKEKLSVLIEQETPEVVIQKMDEVLNSFRQSLKEEIKEKLDEYTFKDISKKEGV